MANWPITKVFVNDYLTKGYKNKIIHWRKYFKHQEKYNESEAPEKLKKNIESWNIEYITNLKN